MTRALQPVPTSSGKALGLAAFRNAQQGNDIVVCGCGQSLRELTNPQRYITIGVNDVGRLFDPTYLVVVNPRNQFKGERFRYIEQSKAQALFTQLDLGKVQPPVVRFKLGQYGGTEIGTGEVLHYTQNSPYVAVCLAAYMGAKRIGLIGVDLTDHHFFAPTGRHSLSARVAEIDKQYGRLAQALEKRGVELVNLSSISRITSLKRVRIEEDGVWSTLAAPRPVAVAPERHALHSANISMKIAIEKRSVGLDAQLLDALAETAAQLGYQVMRDTRASAHDTRILSILWNGRLHATRGPTLYCEHGWLPRSAYQISARGVNAASHLAPFTWDGAPLSEQENNALDAYLVAIKSAAFTSFDRYMQASKESAAGLAHEFLLAPLQIESGTKIIRHAPAHLRTMQAFCDFIAKVNPPWPVIFKQHPWDERHGNRHLRLRLRRAQDLIWPQARGNIHQLLKDGACRGVITINSNVAHDALLWDVPAIVLGHNVWPDSGEHKPFLAAIPDDWSALAQSVSSTQGIACRRAYAYYLMKNQWTLDDARNQDKVAALLAALRQEVAPAPTPTPTPAPRRVAAIVRRPSGPVINVVAENRGWLFEEWKRCYAASSCAGFEVVASNQPLRQADAWIFIRAKEAAASPDFLRTVEQFIAAARSLDKSVRVALIGERLAPALKALARSGVRCSAHGLTQYPMHSTSSGAPSVICCARKCRHTACPPG